VVAALVIHYFGPWLFASLLVLFQLISDRRQFARKRRSSSSVTRLAEIVHRAGIFSDLKQS